MDMFDMARKAIDAQIHRLNGTRPRLPIGQTIQVQGRGDMSAILSLPVLRANAIQDLDPESDTFGEFFWALDFDDLGT